MKDSTRAKQVAEARLQSACSRRLCNGRWRVNARQHRHDGSEAEKRETESGRMAPCDGMKNTMTFRPSFKGGASSEPPLLGNKDGLQQPPERERRWNVSREGHMKRTGE